jgi:hypothetical protein
VDWNDSFRLFLASRSAAVLSELPPDALPLLTVANFAVTRDGLEGGRVRIDLELVRPGGVLHNYAGSVGGPCSKKSVEVRIPPALHRNSAAAWFG